MQRSLVFMSALTIEVPANLKPKLAAAARRLGKSPEEFVRDTLEASLREPKHGSGPSLHEMSRDLCGAVNGGPRDLARNKKRLKGYGSWKR